MGSDKSAVCVFLLAENRLLLDVFVRLLAGKNDIEVVGASPFTRQAILQVVAANPDVVLCDSLSSALSGDDLLLDLRRNLPNAKILLFGMDCDPEKFLIAVERGVTGYVLKDASASEVANAIRAVAQGQPFHIVPSALRSCRKLRFLAARHSGTAESWPHSPRATTGAVSKPGSDQ
jgi:DNA-binding NarL/FixJ family response regulator